MKIFPSSQRPLIERPHSEPLYFCHIYLQGETLYFSDRNFKFNNHDYEAYLFDIPSTIHSIERFGGYLNLNAQLIFRNAKFRSYAKLFDFFLDHALMWREMDIFVVYISDGQIPETDVSTKLHRVSFGEPKSILGDTFDFELFSILYSLDQKKLFTQINRINWPNAAPGEIGKYENLLIGSLKNVPCHCVDTGAASTLYADLTDSATEIYLTDVIDPIIWPISGNGQIGNEKFSWTGRDDGNKKLTGVTRGILSTIASYHKAGEVAWELKSTYKYLAMGGVMKSIDIIKIAGTRVNPADYTITLNDGGKTTFTVTKKALARHSHAMKEIYEIRPTSASHNDFEGTITWFGVDGNVYDFNIDTALGFAYTGAIPHVGGEWVINLPAYSGDPADAVYINVEWDGAWGGASEQYFRLTVPQTFDIESTGKHSTRIKLNNTTIPTQIKFRAHTNSSGSGAFSAYIYEVWIEVERYAVAGSGLADEVLNPLVTVDGEGFKDDASGTYTGIANALIQNPSDIFRFLLLYFFGRSASEIGDSFGSVRTLMANRYYRFAGILSEIGKLPSEIFRKLNEQSRSQIREDGGKWELNFHESPVIVFSNDDSLPSNGAGVVASSEYDGHIAAYSCDDNAGTYWQASLMFEGGYIQVDWGVGIKKIIHAMTLTPRENLGGRVKDFTLKGSDDGLVCIPIYTGVHANNGNKETYYLSEPRAFRFHRLDINTNYSSYGAAIVEWELLELYWNPSSPPSLMTIDKTIFMGDPGFSFTPANQIKNVIRATYDLNHGNNGNRRDYLNQLEIEDDTSIGVYGEALEEVAYSLITNPWMALDVAKWNLVQKKAGLPMVSLICNRRVRALERGDHFTLNDCPISAWEGSLWRILTIGETPNRQQFEISAIKYVAS